MLEFYNVTPIIRLELLRLDKVGHWKNLYDKSICAFLIR